MRLFGLAGALAVACLSAGAASAQDAAPAKVEWIERPDAEALTRFYPAHAQDQDLNGYAVLRCRVGRDGGLEACKVVREEPGDEQFGAAALALAWSFRAEVPADGGDPVGREIDLPIRFAMPGAAAPTAQETARFEAEGREALGVLGVVLGAWFVGWLVVTGLLIVWPTRRVLGAAGIDKRLAFLFLIPGFGAVVPWLLAAQVPDERRPGDR